MNWHINFRFGEWIHPEDAARAIGARFLQSCNDRKNVSEQFILEDFFIVSLANNWPPNQQQKEMLIELLSDKKFLVRLVRALKTGRTETWDKYDILILSNWREIRIRPDILELIEKQEGKLPGLQHWSPSAIEQLFELKYPAIWADSGFDDWFRKRRARLGLEPKDSYRIKKFTVKWKNGSPDEIRINSTDRTEKTFLASF